MAYRKSDNETFVMKETQNFSDAQTELIKQENKLLQIINSDYVMRAEAIYEYNERLYLFLEFMDGKSLTEIAENFFNQYSEGFKKYTLWSAAKGLAAMHELNILHRDIKSDNIFCKSSGEVKIADLGASVCLTKEQAYRKTRCGTNQWVSPEIASGQIYSKEIDVWSFGCFMYEIGTGKPPFSKYKQGESLFKAVIAADPSDIRCNEQSQ